MHAVNGLQKFAETYLPHLFPRFARTMDWVKVVVMLPNPLRQAIKLSRWCADITGFCWTSQVSVAQVQSKALNKSTTYRMMGWLAHATCEVP